MRIEKVLHQLSLERDKLSSEALDKPAGRDAYEYGRVVGMRAGLTHAINTVGRLLEDEARRTNSM